VQKLQPGGGSDTNLTGWGSDKYNKTSPAGVCKRKGGGTGPRKKIAMYSILKWGFSGEDEKQEEEG